MSLKESVLTKLTSVTDPEWRVAAKRCKEHLKLKRRVFTKFGAHSEKNLGVSPFEYYFNEAILRLFDGRWEWKFENFSIDEQIIRIVDSMLSEEVRKTKTAKSQRLKLVYEDPQSDLWKFDLIEAELDENPEEEFATNVDLIKNAIIGNSDLELLFLYIQEGKKPKEIAAELDIPIDKVYKLAEKLKDTVKKSTIKK